MPANAGTLQPCSDNSEQDEWRSTAPTSALIERRTRDYFEAVLAWTLRDPGDRTFREVEQALLPLVFTLGRLFLALFLSRRHEELQVEPEAHREGRRFRRKQAQGRELGTFFGKVRYWRTYMHAQGGGFYPLDQILRIPADGFSFGLTSLMTRVATKVSYAQTALLLRCFLSWSPSTTSIERAVLGLGRRTQAWFEVAPVPDDDGDVLVVMLDGKATPTATQGELRKRRGKRRRVRAPSPRHRGRKRRKGWKKKPRRKRGDKTKNGRSTTVIVMYTLKTTRSGRKLVRKGPINRWVYASYAGRNHAFAIARREADRRGFHADSGKLIQIVVDGEPGLEKGARAYFPSAIVTLDVIHAVEYIWKAGRCLHKQESKALSEWATERRAWLYAGRAAEIVSELEEALLRIPKSGPGNKTKRKGLRTTIGYLQKRLPMMNYDYLLKQDLEIGTGSVEGAVRYVVAQRFDMAGMRWIRERAEALLQLRCIEVNGQWDEFVRFVERRTTDPPGEDWRPLRLQAAKPAPLPAFGADSLPQAA